MKIAYVEGAAPDLSKGEAHELFYKVRDVEEIMLRMKVDPQDSDSLEAKMVYDWICNNKELDLELPFNQVLTMAVKQLRKTTKLPAKRNILKQLRLNPPKCEDKMAWFKRSLITKKVRSESGVLVVTVLTSPYPSMEGDEEGDRKPFSCAYDCHYCPNQPGQPRSYLRDEPAVLRANQNGFDAVLQFTDRCATLFENGHEIDKLEILILGGTWSSYPMHYREVFVRDLFYAANTFMISQQRPRATLQEEMLWNETAKHGCRIIGLTIETRPDCVNRNELLHFRRIGCTRVQFGLQHTDNRVLKRVNRGHTVEQAMEGIKLLKNAGFKVDAHLMPNLPGSSAELDREMLHRMSTDPELSVDQIKVYPTAIVPFTRIEKWFKEGTYVPYALQDMMEVLIDFKTSIPPWIRLNRVVRDIPDMYQDACGVSEEGHLPTNWRNTLQEVMRSRGVKCRCIRCRECSGSGADASQAKLICREFPASGGGIEFFLSFESKEHIFGFCRMRICPEQDNEEEEEATFPELRNAALVRELHVYGLLVPTTGGAAKKRNAKQAQHGGFGKKLLLECERIVLSRFANRCNKLCVISGVGVREFYKSQGWYALEGEGQFLAKDLKKQQQQPLFWCFVAAAVVVALLVRSMI